MKIFIAFLICIVAVLGGELEAKEKDKRMHELMKQSGKACMQELKLNLDPPLADDAPAGGNPPGLDDDNDCYHACVDQKMGLMNEDGTYNLEPILTVIETDQERQRIENVFNTNLKECATIVGKNPCKIAGCIRKSLKSYYANKDHKVTK